MAVTDLLFPDHTVELPAAAGDQTASRFEPDDAWLIHASREHQLAAMWRWFATRYDDPREAVPHDESGDYLYTDGGPFKASQVLRERFGGVVADDVIATLLDAIHREVGEDWALRGIDKAGA